MNDVSNYLIQLCGQVDEGEINVMSPIHMVVVQEAISSTLFMVGTDQSGLIGLLRHLHGLGFVLVSVSRMDTDKPAVVAMQFSTEKDDTAGVVNVV